MKEKVLAEYEAEKFLAKHLPVAKSVLVKSEKQLEPSLKKFHFPVVMKIISKDALHKSDIGGVIIVKKHEEAAGSYRELLKKAKKIKLEGILLQEFVEGKEVIMGIKHDATFGHVIAFGIGGKYVEIFRDISFRVCPITKQDAEEMVDELKFGKFLFGARGEKTANREVLVRMLVKLSDLAKKNRKIKELDINPFMINDRTGKVADARIVFS